MNAVLCGTLVDVFVVTMVMMLGQFVICQLAFNSDVCGSAVPTACSWYSKWANGWVSDRLSLCEPALWYCWLLVGFLMDYV